MPYNKIVVAQTVIARAIEAQGIFQYGNRGYDSLCKAGATTVRRPKLPTLVVKKNTGTASDSADRKGTKSDVTMVDTDLDIYAVPIKDELAAQFESNRQLLNEFSISAAKSLTKAWDTDFITAAQATTNVFDTAASGVLAFKDIIKVKKEFHKHEVPIDQDGLVLCVSAELEDQLMDIDVFKQAAAFNLKTFESGKFLNVWGMNVFISGLVPKVSDKDCIVGIYGPGLASIISHTAETKESWNGTLLQDDIDIVSHAAFELDDNDFAVVVKLK